MKIKSLLIDFVSSFAVVLVVASIVTYLWNFMFHETASVDWETSFRLAIIFGIVLPWIRASERKKQKNGG